MLVGVRTPRWDRKEGKKPGQKPGKLLHELPPCRFGMRMPGKGHLDEPKGHLDEPKGHLDKPKGHLDEPKGHLDEPARRWVRQDERAER